MVMPWFRPKQGFLAKKKIPLKKTHKDELKCRRMPRRVFHEQGDYNRADSFLARQATDAGNTLGGRAGAVPLLAQGLLTSEYWGRQAPKRPPTQGEAAASGLGRAPDACRASAG